MFQNRSVKKLLFVFAILVLAPLVGGLYGIIHDQITYTISPEYYTKFKFFQFGLMDLGDEAIFPNPRIEVSIVGFLATWWMGLPIGIVLALVGLIHENPKDMYRLTMKAMLLTICVSWLTGLIGLAFGKFYLAEKGVNWWLPENLIDTKNFIAVGSMHNFSYLGGLFGLVTGVIYHVKHKSSLIGV